MTSALFESRLIFGPSDTCIFRSLIFLMQLIDLNYALTDTGAIITFGWGLYGQVHLLDLFPLAYHLHLETCILFLNLWNLS